MLHLGFTRTSSQSFMKHRKLNRQCGSCINIGDLRVYGKHVI